MGVYGGALRDARSRDPRQSNSVYEQLSYERHPSVAHQLPSRFRSALPVSSLLKQRPCPITLATLPLPTLTLRR